MTPVVGGSGSFSLEVPPALSGDRVDRALSLVAGISRREAAELVDEGRVRLDGVIVDARSRRIATGQLLAVEIHEGLRTTCPEADPTVRFDVVHEDRSLIVVDKPAGLVVHPGAGTSSPTLVGGLLARYPELRELPSSGAGEADRPGIVHRLDKGTSGLLVVARTAEAYRMLTEQFREHSAGRTYTALVEGSLEAGAGLVDAPIGRSQRAPERMAVAAGGRPARTRYEVVRRFAGDVALTLIDAVLETGRTHQVRVHLAAIGHPVVGDERYGRASRASAAAVALAPGRLFLHARLLEIDHPEGARVRWSSQLPEDLRSALGRLESR